MLDVASLGPARKKLIISYLAGLEATYRLHPPAPASGTAAGADDDEEVLGPTQEARRSGYCTGIAR